MDRIDLLKAVAAKYPETFIGYGNPNSDILIIGKECGFEPDTEDDFFKELNLCTYYNNAAAWDKYCKEPYSSSQIADWKEVLREEWNEKFSPRFAFRGQLFTKKDVVGTSTTWYMYQKLLDIIRSVNRGNNELLDFQDHCFITELNGLPMKMSRPSNDVKKSIDERVNGLFKEAFFQSFPLIIAASKGYVYRYRIKLTELFPNARIIVTNQLSMMPRKGYLDEIAEWVNSNEAYSEL